MSKYREFVVTILSVFLLSVVLIIADGIGVVSGAVNNLVTISTSTGFSSTTSACTPAYPSEPLLAVPLDVYIDPAQNTITVPPGKISIQPTLSVAAEDQGKQAQLVMYIYLPSYNSGFLLNGPTTNLGNTVCFDSFFRQCVDLTKFDGLIADIYYGYIFSNVEIKYNVYRLIVRNLISYYQDADGDGYGNPNMSLTATSQPPGYVTNNIDCDDTNANVNPGATEIADGIDNDCDGQVDENASTLLKWKYQTSDMVGSTSAIGSDGTIYVGSWDGYLYALNPDGTLKWKYQTSNWIYSSPAIGSDGTIYVGSGDSYLYALNPDGTLKWRHQTGGWIYSSPAIGSDGTIYVGSGDGYLYALNPDGTLKWKYQTGGWIYSSPAIGGDGTIYVGSGDSYLYALNPDGTLKWKHQTGGWIYSSPAIGSDGTIYVGSYDGYLYALNPDWTLKWKYQTSNWIYSSPAIGSDGTIYVGSYDGYLYALNPDGTLKWKYQTSNWAYSSPAIGSDGTIYVGSDDGYLYALYPDYTEKSP
jgi:outer membrane protein assembly factor BamB